MPRVRRSVFLVLLVLTTSCSDRDAAPRAVESGGPPVTATPQRAGGERDGVVKAPPTTRLAETDEFGLVVSTRQVAGATRVEVDRVDSLTGDEGARAAAARGQDYANDHVEVNDDRRTRQYVLAEDVDVWKANPADAGNPVPMTVAEWLAFVSTAEGRQGMFHFDVEDGQVVGVEQQYFP